MLDDYEVLSDYEDENFKVLRVPWKLFEGSLNTSNLILSNFLFNFISKFFF